MQAVFRDWPDLITDNRIFGQGHAAIGPVFYHFILSMQGMDVKNPDFTCQREK